ncbi:asparagine synthase-related protein [Streptomyces sp. HU2014]|uniref:asparagine synthase-related protein n=1 Tax=Streptomyces sp. HU2014 TaxID=2939414 RepID=UPI00200BC163|nr:asparagine synthase-related protein [Streptomyces sp. HU2014]UQI46864.1 asparagine synthase-related protein [Streptomyces sp. HU2014]
MTPGRGLVPRAGCWFTVLPDGPHASTAVRRLRGRGCRTVAHASGRPWLLGCWTDDELVVARQGEVRLAVAGPCSLGEAELTGRLRGVRSPSDVEDALRGAHGGFHALASLGGEVYARGGLSGARRLYWTSVDGTAVAADRARTLAWLTDADPDPAQLAARLAGPGLPYPLDGGAMWCGVHTVPPGDALRLDRDGNGGAVRRWWLPPPAGLSVAEGAPGLLAALREAVSLRVTPGRVLGADLSGGPAATALCLLAAEAGARLVTSGAPGPGEGHGGGVPDAGGTGCGLPGAGAGRPGRRPDPGRDDPWPTGTHGPVSPGPGLPTWGRREPGDEPSSGLRERARQRGPAGVLSAQGASRLLLGHGGDAAVRPPSAYVHALVRNRPAAGLWHTFGHRARLGWPPGATARMLLDRGSYRDWLGSAADGLDLAAEGPRAPHRWGAVPSLPPWASEECVELVRDLLLGAAAGEVEPLAADRGRHVWVQRIQRAGRAAAFTVRDSAAVGLPADAPFCDDGVLDACLAVRPEEAGTPWAYRPLLIEAMRGVRAEEFRPRVAEEGGPPVPGAGAWEERGAAAVGGADPAAWVDESLLVAAGLVDEEALREAVLGGPGGPPGGGAGRWERTLAVEAWLRELADHPVPSVVEPCEHDARVTL